MSARSIVVVLFVACELLTVNLIACGLTLAHGPLDLPAVREPVIVEVCCPFIGATRGDIH